MIVLLLDGLQFQFCAFIDRPTPQISIESNLLPVVEVEAALSQVGFDLLPPL
ncbi:hypothetical protein JOB18_001568, partial [Solea senegalensis]